MRKPVVGVMGGSKADEATRQAAFELGRLIAERGWILLNGGRDRGVMAASAAGAKEAGGLVIGVLPDRSTKKASPDLDVAIVTGQGDDRNLTNVLSTDVVIACRGELGTLTEIAVALKNGKRVILLDRTVGEDFAKYYKRGQLTSARTPEEAVTQAADVLSGSR